MYLSFYGLQKKPFQVSTDPAFLWLGEKHKEALAILKYGNLGNQGIILLTGDPGTGKTTLINALLNSLGDEVIVGKVPDPGMEVIDFMNYVSHAFGMNKKFVSKDAFLIHFGHFLNSTHAAGKKSLLIIDEAQRLSPALLEEIRQLSNIEKQETKLLSIFFVGQSEFNDVLLEHKNRALRQRISLNYVIEPLDLYETGEFIRHRLNIAGAEEDIFSPDAIRNVYEFSGGFPRSVNIICDHSLLLGFGESSKTVTGEIVKDCAKDLLPPEFFKNKNNKSQQSVDTADSDILEEIPPERIQEVSSRKGLKTFSYVALIAMVVFTLIVIMYPVEHWDLFSRVNNNEVESYSGESEVNRLSANSYPEQDREIISVEGVSTNLKTMGAEEGGKEAATAQVLLVEDVKPVSAVSEDDRPDIPEEKPIVPDRLNKAEEGGKEAETAQVLLVEDVKPVSVVSEDDRPDIPEEKPIVPDSLNKAEEGGKEAATAQELLVEEVKPVSVVSEDDRPDIPEEKPIVPDSLNKAEEGGKEAATAQELLVEEVKPVSVVSEDDRPDIPEEKPIVPDSINKAEEGGKEAATAQELLVEEVKPVSVVSEDDRPDIPEEKPIVPDSINKAEEGGKEAATAQELLVEEVKPVSVVSGDDRPDIPEEKPIVPDSLNKGTVRPEDGKDRIAISSFHSTQLISPSNPSQKNPSSEEKTQNNALISVTNEVVNKEPEAPDPGALIDRLIIKRSK